MIALSQAGDIEPAIIGFNTVHPHLPPPYKNAHSRQIDAAAGGVLGGHP